MVTTVVEYAPGIVTNTSTDTNYACLSQEPKNSLSIYQHVGFIILLCLDSPHETTEFPPNPAPPSGIIGILVDDMRHQALPNAP